MTVLAVDTSSRHRALCVVAGVDGTLLDHRRLPGGNLDRELPAALAALLLRDDLSAVACVVGPGSYTGLRVGIAAALGIAHARDLPLHGIDALEVVALAAPGELRDVIAFADAGRGARYVAAYRREGDGVVRTGAARRLDPGAGWAVSGRTVSFDAVPGALDVEAQGPAALAAAAAAALRQAPLSRAGLGPIYLSGDASHAGEPRV
jgi:tRNA threonylcarbamoyladenosine biosynthesis protein TsaB